MPFSCKDRMNSVRLTCHEKQQAKLRPYRRVAGSGPFSLCACGKGEGTDLPLAMPSHLFNLVTSVVLRSPQ